jgi:hypothetical protein
MRRGLFAGTFACLNLISGSAHAGAYTGFENDNEGSSLYFFGVQGGNRLMYELFLDDLDYEYLDGGVTIKVNQQNVTPTIGMRWTRRWTFSLSAGPNVTIKTKKSIAGTVDSTDTGGILKFSLASYKHDLSRELLGSYSTGDEFLWTRARLKKRVAGAFSLGGELFWMGNQDADSSGGGVLFDLSGKRGGVTLKVGYKKSTNNRQTVYEGLDAFIPF